MTANPGKKKKAKKDIGRGFEDQCLNAEPHKEDDKKALRQMVKHSVEGLPNPCKYKEINV